MNKTLEIVNKESFQYLFAYLGLLFFTTLTLGFLLFWLYVLIIICCEKCKNNQPEDYIIQT